MWQRSACLLHDSICCVAEEDLLPTLQIALQIVSQKGTDNLVEASQRVFQVFPTALYSHTIFDNYAYS